MLTLDVTKSRREVSPDVERGSICLLGFCAFHTPCDGGMVEINGVPVDDFFGLHEKGLLLSLVFKEGSQVFALGSCPT